MATAQIYPPFVQAGIMYLLSGNHLKREFFVPIRIEFELSDEDIERFAEMANVAQKNPDPVEDVEAIIAAAKETLQQVKSSPTPEFIENRIGRLELLIDMIADDEWMLPENAARRVVSAMTYFSEPDDLIADDIPGIGFLDDAIMVEVIFKTLEPEVSAFLEFSAFRSTEERRLKREGLSPDDDRDNWLQEKRAELHKRIGEQRDQQFVAGVWRVSR
jgi:uncharacterized membrane protein YkvA (DUF1232 family)